MASPTLRMLSAAEVCGMSVPPLMMWEIAKSVKLGLDGSH